MTTGELIAQLQQHDPTKPVEIQTSRTSKQPILKVREGFTHYYNVNTGETEQFSFLLIQTEEYGE